MIRTSVKRSWRWRCLGAATFLLCGAFTNAAAGEPSRASDDPIGVVEVVLDNGLTVLLSENHERAEVFGAVVVRAGGKNDPAEHTGIAHYLEHMLFKGTQTLGTVDYEKERPHLDRIEALYERLARTSDDEARRRIEQDIDAAAAAAGRLAIPNEIDHLLAEIGGTDVNAFTTSDVTVYYNLLPASQLATWLDIYAQRFEQPVFRLFPSELEAVYEEKNRSMEGFMEPAYEAFMREFFAGHPYGEQPVLGHVEHLKRPSLTAMRQFYERWYVAPNMAVVLSGDFETDEVLPLVRATFGRWPSAPVPEANLPDVVPPSGRRVVTQRLTPIRAAAFGFHTPPQGHPDHPALQVALEILSNDDGAGTLDRIADDGRLLTAMILPLSQHDHDGVVVLLVPRVLTQSMAAAERLVRRAIDDVREGRTERAVVEAARDNLLRELTSQWESNEARALVMADTWARRQPWRRYLDMIGAIESVTPQQVADAADRWLADDYLLFRSRRGKVDAVRLDKPDATPIPAPTPGVHSPAWNAMHPLPEGDPRPRWVDVQHDLQRRDVAPGVRLVAADNPHNDVHTLQLRFGIGHQARPELARLAEYLPRVGTRERGADGFSRALYEIATTLSAYSTDEELVLELQGPDRHLSRALALVAELMQQPARDGKRLRAIRRQAWASERLDRSEPQNVAWALREHVLYGERSAYRRRGRQALARASVGELLWAWADVQHREATVHYVGRLDPDVVAAHLRDAIPWADDPLPAVPRPYLERTVQAADTVFFVPRRDAVQTQLLFLVDGEPIGPGDLAAMDAFDEYLGGNMGGIVFQEVRELRALAYSAWGGWEEPDLVNRPGLLFGYVGCQADKTEESLRVMTSILRTLPSKPDRVPGVRSALARGQEAADPDFRELPQAVADWRWQGFGADPRRLRRSGYAALSWQDIESFWRRQVAGRPLVLMVVGDPRRVPHELLSQYGKVTTVREGDLYRP